MKKCASPVKKKVLKHLKEDIKGEKKEISEDVALARSLKGKKKKPNMKKIIKAKKFRGDEYGI
jgi:hypothetical protein